MHNKTQTKHGTPMSNGRNIKKQTNNNRATTLRHPGDYLLFAPDYVAAQTRLADSQSQINLKLSHSGPSKRQLPATNQRAKTSYKGHYRKKSSAKQNHLLYFSGVLWNISDLPLVQNRIINIY